MSDDSGTPPSEDTQKILEAKIHELFADRIVMWHKAHPGQRLPIVIVEGEPRWLSRKERMRIATKIRKEERQ